MSAQIRQLATAHDGAALAVEWCLIAPRGGSVADAKWTALLMEDGIWIADCETMKAARELACARMVERRHLGRQIAVGEVFDKTGWETTEVTWTTVPA